MNPILLAIQNIILQISYDCSSQDKKNLQNLQNSIQERINYLNQNNLDSYADSQLLEYYELYSQIEQCIFQDHTDQYFLIAILVIVIPLLLFFRWRMVKKAQARELND